VAELLLDVGPGLPGLAPDAAGPENWVQYITRTRDLEGAAAGFLASPEFEARAHVSQLRDGLVSDLSGPQSGRRRAGRLGGHPETAPIGYGHTWSCARWPLSFGSAL
jgi:hypothetical protein